MERILSTEQMRFADKFTIENLGVCEDDLVLRAGKAVADEIIGRFRGGRVLVCIGKGNNGADGKIIAQLLSKEHGFSVATLTVSNGIFKIFDNKFDIIVDCIFGTGLNRVVEGKYKTAIEKINQSGAYVISCDIPSGLNGDLGKAMGVAVKANLTVAIQEFKLGHFLNDGPDYCGVVVAKDIGISIWGDDYVKRLTEDTVKKFFTRRNRNTHKGCYGKVCVFGGSKKYSGSVILSINALCALKMGAGYANLAIPNSLFNAYLGVVPECILTAVKDKDGFILFDKDVLDSIAAFDVIAIGMGMDVSEQVYKTIEYLLKNYKGKLLIDADGLNSIAKYGVDVLKDKVCDVIITPHIGEFSRLCNVSVAEIKDDSINLAKSFALKYGVKVVLKNAVSVITDGEQVFLNTTGTPAMAKAGSGDVFSGFAAGLMVRSQESLVAIAAAAYTFGKAGEYAVKEEHNEYSVVASDIISSIPKVIHSMF